MNVPIPATTASSRTATGVALALGLAGLVGSPSDVATAAEDDDGPAVRLERSDDRVTVKVGGDLFTEYRFKGFTKPVLYPLMGPGGVRMNREFPFRKGVDGEASDHPHHESLWFTHGDVNGVSFWHIADDTGMIVSKSVEIGGPDALTAKNEWVDAAGKVVCTDTTTIRFGVEDDGSRTIDYRVTVHASHGKVTFGDTKEGTMGIRTHPALRLSNDPGRGVTGANGKAVNSAGDRDKELWGKHAAWVDYWGTIDGEEVGVAIFDHPGNPRHPTTWHAREYGLVAANPFGLSNFEGKPKGTGDLVIEEGDSVTFHYRFVFHPGDFESAQVAERFKRWAESAPH